MLPELDEADTQINATPKAVRFVRHIKQTPAVVVERSLAFPNAKGVKVLFGTFALMYAPNELL